MNRCEHITKNRLLMPPEPSMGENLVRTGKKRSQPRTEPPLRHQPQPHHLEVTHRRLLPAEADWLKLGRQPRQNNQTMRKIHGTKATDHDHLGHDDGWKETQKKQKGTHHRPGEAEVPIANLAKDMHTAMQETTRNAQTTGQISISGELRACFEHRGLEISDSVCGNFTSGGGTQVP